MAMSTARKTLDFEKEFAQTRDAIGAMLGAKLQPVTPSRKRPRSPHRPQARKIRPGKIMDLTQASSSFDCFAAPTARGQQCPSTPRLFDERPFLKRLGPSTGCSRWRWSPARGSRCSRYYPFMNYYDKLVLCCAVPAFVVLGWRWKPVRLLIACIAALSLLAMQLYHARSGSRRHQRSSSNISCRASRRSCG